MKLRTAGLLIISMYALGCELAAFFHDMMAPENAWRVHMTSDYNLSRESSSGRGSQQPARSFFQRISDFFFRLIPMEGQL